LAGKTADDVLFEIADPDLPINYTTFMALHYSSRDMEEVHRL